MHTSRIAKTPLWRASAKIVLWRALISIVLLGAENLAVAQASPATPQPASSQLAKEIQDLKAEAIQANARIARLEKENGLLAAVKDKLDKTTWLALDATTKIATLQWATLALTLTSIAVALTLLGFFGFAGFRYLHDKIYNDVRESLRKDEEVIGYDIQAVAFGNMGFEFWKQYYRAKSEQGALGGEASRNLESALGFSSVALTNIEKLEAALTKNPKQEEDARERAVRLVTTVKANYAYWLAEQDDPNPQNLGKPNPANRELAMRLGREACAVALTYMKMDGTKQIDAWPAWAESHCHVLTRYGDDQNAEQKKSAQKLIAKILNDARVDEDWKTTMRNKYFGNAPRNEMSADNHGQQRT